MLERRKKQRHRLQVGRSNAASQPTPAPIHREAEAGVSFLHSGYNSGDFSQRPEVVEEEEEERGRS